MTGERMKYLERLRAQATITWRNDELKKAYEHGAGRSGEKALGGMTGRLVVRALDALAPRAGGARAARTEADRSLPADGHEVEPLEGPQEEDRLAAVSRATASRGSTRATACRS